MPTNEAVSTEAKLTPRERNGRSSGSIVITRARSSIPTRAMPGYADFLDSDDILSELFARGARAHVRAHGRGVRYRLALDFLDAVNGATKRVNLPDGSALDVTVPAGTQDGQILRLRGKGGPGVGGGEPGDALVEIEVRPHRFFTR